MPASSKPLNPSDDLTQRHLRALRQELAVVLQNQMRDCELITRLHARMDQGFTEIRRDVGDLRSDVILLENNLLSRHNDLLDLSRRMDDPDSGTSP
jgi:hypothetical protein